MLLNLVILAVAVLTVGVIVGLVQRSFLARSLTLTIFAAILSTVLAFEYYYPRILVKKQCQEGNIVGHVKAESISFIGFGICLDCLHYNKWVQGYKFLEFETGDIFLPHYFNGRELKSNTRYRIEKVKNSLRCQRSTMSNRRVTNRCLVLSKVESFKSPNVVLKKEVFRRNWPGRLRVTNQIYYQKPHRIIARSCDCQYHSDLFFGPILNDMSTPNGFGSASCKTIMASNAHKNVQPKDFLVSENFRTANGMTSSE